MIQKLVFVIFCLIHLCYTQTVNVKDVDDNILIQINDEGNDGGSLTLPDASSVTTPDDKLYNIAGELRWYGRSLDDCEITREEFDDLMSDYEVLELRVVELEGVDCNSLWYSVCGNYQTSGPCGDAGFCSWTGSDCEPDWSSINCAQYNGDQAGCEASSPACGYFSGNCEKLPDVACGTFSEADCGVICEQCEWVGDQCRAVTPDSEICDGIDNDCDGLIDEEGCT